MIEINLAPGSEKRRKAPSRFQMPGMPQMPALGAHPAVIAGGALALLLLLTLGFLIWRTGARANELRTQIEQEVTDSTRFAATIELITQVRERQDTVRQKIQVIRSVDQRRYVWPHLLDEISAAVPEYTWLEQITSAQPDSLATGPSFTLQGNAGSTQSLTRFMKNLEESPFIRDVTLVTSQQDEVEGRAIHRFTLEAGFEDPDSSAIRTVPILVNDVEP